MFDLGWSELLVIGIAALIVVGPKDLPRMLRTLGQYAAKARSVAREFQRAMDEAAREADIAELHEVKKTLDEVRQVPYEAQRELGQSFLDAERSIEKELGSEAVEGPGRAAESAGRTASARARGESVGSAPPGDRAPSRPTAAPPLSGPGAPPPPGAGSGSAPSRPPAQSAEEPARQAVDRADAGAATDRPARKAAGSKASGA